MRKFPRLFPLFLFAALALPVLAEDWTKKDPDALARETRKIAAQLRQEADYFQAGVQKAGRELSADEKKYLTYTLEEAGLLEKSHEAWEKNQKRMAEKFREKAGELCSKRGELAAKLKLWEEKPAASHQEKKAGPKGQPDNAAKLAEIERQQAELEKKKKELEAAQAAGR